MIQPSLQPVDIRQSYLFADNLKQDEQDRLPTSDSMNMVVPDNEDIRKVGIKLSILQPQSSTKISPSFISKKYKRIFNYNRNAQNQRIIQNQSLSNYQPSSKNRKKKRIFTHKAQEQLIQNRNAAKERALVQENGNRRDSLNQKQSIILDKWQKKLEVDQQKYYLPYQLFRGDSHNQIPLHGKVNTLESNPHDKRQSCGLLMHLNPANQKVKRRSNNKKTNNTKERCNRRRFNSMIKGDNKPIDQKEYSNSVGSKISHYNIKESMIRNSLVDRNLKLTQSFLSSEFIHEKRYFDEEISTHPLLQKISYRNIDLPITTEDTEPAEDCPQIKHHHLFSDFERSAKKESSKSRSHSPRKEAELKQIALKSIKMELTGQITKFIFPFVLIGLVFTMLFIQMIC